MGDDYDEPPLPDELYDVIIVGTGITESILAGAVSRVGRRVLHVDANDYYGADFATFSLEQAAAWACDNRPPSGGSGGSGGGAPVAGAEARGDGEELVGSESQLPVSVLSVEVLAQRVNDGEAAQRAAVAAQHPAYGGARAFAVGSHEVRPLLDPEVTTPVFWGHTRRALEPSPRPLAAAALRSEPLPAAVPRGHAPVVAPLLLAAPTFRPPPGPRIIFASPCWSAAALKNVSAEKEPPALALVGVSVSAGTLPPFEEPITCN